MSGFDNNSNNRMQNAEQRLAQAIGRLEAALDAQGNNASKADVGLAQELSRLQTENVELRTLVGRASASLDTTITKLKTQLTG